MSRALYGVIIFSLWKEVNSVTSYLIQNPPLFKLLFQHPFCMTNIRSVQFWHEILPRYLLRWWRHQHLYFTHDLVDQESIDNRANELFTVEYIWRYCWVACCSGEMLRTSNWWYIAFELRYSRMVQIKFVEDSL